MEEQRISPEDRMKMKAADILGKNKGPNELAVDLAADDAPPGGGPDVHDAGALAAKVLPDDLLREQIAEDLAETVACHVADFGYAVVKPIVKKLVEGMYYRGETFWKKVDAILEREGA